VVAIFNTRLGERVRSFFTDRAVLSGSAMSAPSFAAAAGAARRLAWHKFGAAFAVLFAVLVVGFIRPRLTHPALPDGRDPPRSVPIVRIRPEPPIIREAQVSPKAHRGRYAQGRSSPWFF
jgi:hypothetical protein